MKRKLVMLATAMMILALAAPAWAEFLDFTQLPSSPGSQGASLAFDGLTITAKTTMGAVNNIPDPWMTTAAGGVAGNVYWGDLGTLGAINSTATTTTWNAAHTISTTRTITKENIPALSSSNYIGLGVLKTTDPVADNTTGPITFKEALVFDFALPQDPKNALVFGTMQSSTELSFTMLGVNGGYLKTTTITTITNTVTGAVTTSTAITQTANDTAADNVRVFLKLAGGEVLPFDINYGAVPADGVEWNNWIRWALNQVNYADERIVGLAVEQTYNPNREFGVGSITFDAPTSVAVPEPFTLILLGAGLIGLAGIRRFKK